MCCTAMWILASGVAAIAAIVLYSDIYDLGRAHGGNGTPARPAAAVVDMLDPRRRADAAARGRHQGRRFVLGLGTCSGQGSLATLAANVAFGASSARRARRYGAGRRYLVVLAAWAMGRCRQARDTSV